MGTSNSMEWFDRQDCAEVNTLVHETILLMSGVETNGHPTTEYGRHYSGINMHFRRSEICRYCSRSIPLRDEHFMAAN
jgi:hypothetical protein